MNTMRLSWWSDGDKEGVELEYAFLLDAKSRPFGMCFDESVRVM